MSIKAEGTGVAPERGAKMIWLITAGRAADGVKLSWRRHHVAAPPCAWSPLLEIRV